MQKQRSPKSNGHVVIMPASVQIAFIDGSIRNATLFCNGKPVDVAANRHDMRFSFGFLTAFHLCDQSGFQSGRQNLNAIVIEDPSNPLRRFIFFI